MNRRHLLKLAGAATLIAGVPAPLRALAQQAAPAARGRVLLLVELKGGNDGLNMVAPVADPLYHRLRPNLAIAKDAALPLKDGLAFNPVLKPLMGSWQAGDLAIARGVGYPQPNRSHFRSIEIWETASNSQETLQEGWVAAVLKGNVGRAADGIVIGDYEFGPLEGGAMRNVIFDKPDQFIAQAKRMRAIEAQAGGALGHLLRVRGELLGATGELEPIFADPPKLAVEFPPFPFAQQAKVAAQLIAADAGVPVLKLAQRGYDTHVNQRNQHDRLLGQLAEALAAVRAALIAAGRWDDVLIMTYSEFGRRAAENASRGTDHGTAAPHLLLGGRVKGGFHGAQPRLDDLDAGDLKFATDYRRLYATVARRWWGLGDQAGDSLGRLATHRPLDLIA